MRWLWQARGQSLPLVFKKGESMTLNLDAWLDHEWAKACEADDVEEGMIQYWGEKCPDYDRQCPTCQAWKEFEASGEIVKTYKEFKA
jgi:hypothetical protein